MGLTYCHTPVFIFKHIQKDFFSLPKERTWTWSLAVWGFVRFGSVQSVCEGRLGLQGTAEPFSSTAGTFGKTHLGKGEISLQPLEDRGGAGTNPTAGRSALKELQSAGPTPALLSWRTAPHGGGDPHWGRGKCQEGEATGRSCCGLTPNPYFPLPLHHLQGEKAEEPGMKLSLGKGRDGGQQCSTLLLTI